MAKKSTKKSSPTPKKQPVKRQIKGAKKSPVAKKKLTKPSVKSATHKDLPSKAVAAKHVATKPLKAKKTRPVAAPVVESKPVPPLPEKIKSVLGRKDLDHFRDLLLAKRRELLGDVHSMEDEALRNSGGTNLSNLPIHMADMGTDNYEQEFTLGLVEKDRKVLRDIHAALTKMHEGTYGICEGTGKPISKARLEVQPWTRFSIEYARNLERRRP